MHPSPLFRSTGRLFPSHSIQLNHFKRAIGEVPRRASLASISWYSTRSSTAERQRVVNGYPGYPRWEPGLEPGLDPERSVSGSTENLSNSECHITVIDYSKDRIETQHLDNGSLTKWIEREGKRADWAKCRWINVDGLSWDVIQALGRYKNLHKLAIEDLVNTENRTKADWYSDHTYIVLTLQKLVHAHEGRDKTHDHQSSKKGPAEITSGGWMRNYLRKLLLSSETSQNDYNHPKYRDTETSYTAGNDGFILARTGSHVQRLRRLQRYRSHSDPERLDFMVRNSVLARKNLVVCAEQVSIFLLSDNTVISFFEASAEDVEQPVCARLANTDTVLRQSCDASLLTQSIIDTVIDLAIPVSTAYQDVIETLELDVLTKPNITHARDLYMITSEINTMRNFITPIASLIANLGEQGSGRISPSLENPPNASSAVQISPLTQMYFRDVEDHCFLITQSLNQLEASAKGMIDLLFHTISANQNESMKQLTAATMMFLPLTFITGYFGMNLTDFPSLENSESFFWWLATPVIATTALLLLRGKIKGWLAQFLHARMVRAQRRRRKAAKQDLS